MQVKASVQGDYYAILGVSPSSSDVVIRAAYRALMRRHHPDADRSEEATDRARAINAAYAVLGDPEQRRRYDGTLAARGLIRLDQQPRPTGIRVTPTGIGLLAIVAAAAAAFALSPPLESLPDVGRLLVSPTRQALPVHRAEPVAPVSEKAEADCSTDAAKGLIKAQLFDQAARLRGSDPAFLTPVADRTLVRLDLAEARGGGSTGAVSCGGWLAIDLPTDVAVEGGRRNLNAEVIYALVPAGSRGLRLTALSGVNGLAQSLATLGQAGEDTAVELPVAEVAAAEAPAAMAPRRRPTQAAAAAPPARNPSLAREPSPARSRNLAALDSHLDLFLSQSLARADARKTASLKRSDERFRKRRDACRSEACLTAAYIGQMRDVSAIMAAR